MPVSIYDISIPVFERRLRALAAILEKASADCQVRKIDPAALLGARLFPNMFPLVRQVQVSTNHAGRAAARLAGVAVPSDPDVETSFEELQARIRRTLDFIAGIDRAAIEGAETREVKFMAGSQERSMNGLDYLLNQAMPNFYFHVTTAYAILRHNGLDVGKSDFLA